MRLRENFLSSGWVPRTLHSLLHFPTKTPCTGLFVLLCLGFAIHPSSTKSHISGEKASVGGITERRDHTQVLSRKHNSCRWYRCERSTFGAFIPLKTFLKQRSRGTTHSRREHYDLISCSHNVVLLLCGEWHAICGDDNDHGNLDYGLTIKKIVPKSQHLLLNSQMKYRTNSQHRFSFLC